MANPLYRSFAVRFLLTQLQDFHYFSSSFNELQCLIIGQNGESRISQDAASQIPQLIHIHCGLFLLFQIKPDIKPEEKNGECKDELAGEFHINDPFNIMDNEGVCIDKAGIMFRS
jgi:hypothetical protein